MLGVSSARKHIFKETAVQARLLASNRQAMTVKASPWSNHENNGKSKGKSKGTKGEVQVSKGSGNGKTLKMGIPDLENLKSETSSETQEFKWDRFVPLRRRGIMMNGVLTNGTTTVVWTNGMMTGVVLDGMMTANGCVVHL